MLDDEVRQLLRELTGDTGAVVASVVHESPGSSSSRVRVAPLGSGAFLCLELQGAGPGGLMMLSSDAVSEIGTQASDSEIAEAMARSARALRASARRWGRKQVPACTFRRRSELSSELSSRPSGERVRDRIRAYLEALASTHRAESVTVTLGTRIVASTHPADELSHERIPFIARRVEVEAQKRKTSHAELVGGDFYALSFWFDACLVAFFSAPFATDFVRHRARMVARELVPLLTMLDDPPPAPARISPIPE